MKKHVLVLTMSAFVLACGPVAASAQQSPGTAMMQQADQQHAQHHPADQEAPMSGQGGMMGCGMMGQGGMMGRGGNEGVHLLQSEHAIFVGIHCLEGFFLSRQIVIHCAEISYQRQF